MAATDISPVIRATNHAAKGIGRGVVAGDAQVLINAVVKGDVHWLRSLCTENGRDVNARNLHMWTPLHIAAVRGSLEAVHMLVGELKANVNPVHDDHGTPLDLALREYHTKVATYLTSKGALRGCNVLTGKRMPFAEEDLPMMNEFHRELVQDVPPLDSWVSHPWAKTFIKQLCGSCNGAPETDQGTEKDTRSVVSAFPVMSAY